MKKMVIICAHPDDAVIFCGGTIIKETSNKRNQVSIISLTGPNSSDEEKEIMEYAKISGCSFDTLGYKSTSNLNHKEIVKKVSSIFIEMSPSIILTHWYKDVHFGHLETYQIVYKALLPFVIDTNGEIKTDFYCFDTYWSKGYDLSIFTPSITIDISDVWDQKLSHIKIFNNKYLDTWIEMSELTNSINGKRSGVNYAEAFLKQSSFSALGGSERAYSSLP